MAWVLYLLSGNFQQFYHLTRSYSSEKKTKSSKKKKNAEHMRRVINANALGIAQECIKMVVKGNLVHSSFLP